MTEHSRLPNLGSEQLGFGRWIAYWAVAGIILFFALIAGLFAGARLATGTARVSPHSLRNNTLLSIGMPLPAYRVKALDTEDTLPLPNFDPGTKRIAIFLSPGCEPCETLTKQWGKHIMPTLKSDIHVILVYQHEDVPVGELEHYNSLSRCEIAVLADDESRLLEDGIGFPTVIAVDEDSKIRFVTTGVSKDIGPKFINDNL